MAVLHHVGPDIAPLFHNLVVQRPRRALGARQCQRTKLKRFGPLDFQVPRPRLQSTRAVS